MAKKHDRELMAAYTRIVVDHGHDSDEAAAFKRRHAENADLMALCRLTDFTFRTFEASGVVAPAAG